MSDSTPDYDRIPAKPTTYRGTRFRSRLEARWAAFFDLCQWNWQYEPFDMDGWLPDFAIKAHKGLVLVEVKPIMQFDYNGPLAQRLIQSVKRSHSRPEVLVLGLGPTDAQDYGSFPAIGWLYEWCWCGDADECTKEHGHPTPDRSAYENGHWFWAEACLSGDGQRDHGPRFDFFHGMNSYQQRVCGAWNGDHHLESVSQSQMDALWGEAQRKVQYRPR